MGFTLHRTSLVPRAISGVSGLFLADLIFGMAAFSAITLGSLWYFCLGWIHLTAEYAAVGYSFGASWQLQLAWCGLFACLPALVGTVYLAVRAFQLPKVLLRRAILSSST